MNDIMSGKDVKSAIKVLFVEDDTEVAGLVRARLSAPEFSDLEIVHVTDLKSALVALNNSCFDVVLTDLNLPDSVGTKTVKRIVAVRKQFDPGALNAAAAELSWFVKPGDYTVRLTEPPASIVVIWDTSGSMGQKNAECTGIESRQVRHKTARSWVVSAPHPRQRLGKRISRRSAAARRKNRAAITKNSTLSHLPRKTVPTLQRTPSRRPSGHGAQHITSYVLGERGREGAQIPRRGI